MFRSAWQQRFLKSFPYLGVIALEDENDLRDWFDAFVDRMNASIPLNADISGSSYEATRGVAWQSEDKGELP